MRKQIFEKIKLGKYFNFFLKLQREIAVQMMEVENPANINSEQYQMNGDSEYLGGRNGSNGDAIKTEEKDEALSDKSEEPAGKEVAASGEFVFFLNYFQWKF